MLIWLIGTIILILGMCIEWRNRDSGVPIICYGVACGMFMANILKVFDGLI